MQSQDIVRNLRGLLFKPEQLGPWDITGLWGFSMSLAGNHMCSPWGNEETFPGVTFQNPQGALECNRIGEAYVDDTEFWLTIPDTDIVQLAKEMQIMSSPQPAIPL